MLMVFFHPLNPYIGDGNSNNDDDKTIETTMGSVDLNTTCCCFSLLDRFDRWGVRVRNNNRNKNKQTNNNKPINDDSTIAIWVLLVVVVVARDFSTVCIGRVGKKWTNN
jgi:hypothetical protein